MLYRPNFCCHCGEKIARSRWTILTSRRFCDFCEIEQKQHDLLPRAIVIVAVLIGAAGFTSYVRSGSSETARNVPRPAPVSAKTDAIPERSPADVRNGNQVAKSESSQTSGDAVNGQLQKRPSSSTEPVFFCQAVTRKGTPCTRRVKAKGRCWQHEGKPDAPDAALSEGNN